MRDEPFSLTFRMHLAHFAYSFFRDRISFNRDAASMNGRSNILSHAELCVPKPSQCESSRSTTILHGLNQL